MRTQGVTMIRGPFVEFGARFGINVAAIENVDALWRILRVELLRHFLQFFLAAAMISHQHNVAKAIDDHRLGNLLVQRRENRPRDPDGARKIRLRVIHGIGNYGRQDGIAQLLRDFDTQFVNDQRVGPIDSLWTPFFGAAVEDDRRGLTVLESLLHLRPRHQLKIHRLREAAYAQRREKEDEVRDGCQSRSLKIQSVRHACYFVFPGAGDPGCSDSAGSPSAFVRNAGAVPLMIPRISSPSTAVSGGAPNFTGNATVSECCVGTLARRAGPIAIWVTDQPREVRAPNFAPFGSRNWTKSFWPWYGIQHAAVRLSAIGSARGSISMAGACLKILKISARNWGPKRSRMACTRQQPG